MAAQSSIDIRCFFKHTKYPAPDWHTPVEAGVDMIHPAEKRPLWYQRLVPVTKLRVSHKLGRGRSASLTLDTVSSRELFDYQDEEGMLWYREPFREWEITLTDRHTSSSEIVFRGFPVYGDVRTLDDRVIPDQQDGNWEITVRLEGPEHFLQSNTGLHHSRTLKAYSYNPILSLILSELDQDSTPLSHTQYSFDYAAPEHQLEPFLDLGNTDINPEISVYQDSTTWDLLKKIADDLSKYSLNSDGAASHLPQGNTYVPAIDNDFTIDFIPANFRDGQEPDEWFSNTEDTFTGGTGNTRILGESPDYGIIGQEFTAQDDFSGVYVYADPATFPNDGLVQLSLKDSREGTVLETETIRIQTPESSYSFRFPTQHAGTYYLEIESVLGNNRIAFRTWENSTYSGGKLWLHDGSWTSPANEDLEMKLLSPPYIKLSPGITKEHVAIQTSATVKGLCEDCPDAEYGEAKHLFNPENGYDSEILLSGSKTIGQQTNHSLPANALNALDIPVRNTSDERALAKLTLYNNTAKTIIHTQALVPVPANTGDFISARIPAGVYTNYTTTYYWELEAVSGSFSVPCKNGLYSGIEIVSSYEDSVLVTDKHFAEYFIRGKNCTGWARYPERSLRDSADPADYERPDPPEYGIRGERVIQVDFNSDWVSHQAKQLTRCRNLAKEHVLKHNYPSYTAEFTITGGYAPDLVGKYVLLYNHYEGQDQTFLVTEQIHEFEKGWNSLVTSFTAVRSGNKP